MDVDSIGSNSQALSTLHITPDIFTLSTLAPHTSDREIPPFRFPTDSPVDIDPPSTTDNEPRKRSLPDTGDATELAAIRPSPATGRRKSQLKSDMATRMSSSKDYPRRRALQACQICRARKTKCDNERPSCGSCEALGVECNYNEAPASKSFCSHLLLT